MSDESPFDLARIGGRVAFDGLIRAVVAAGDHALAMQRQVRTERKGDDTPVTEADRETERRLREHMAAHFPQVRFFGEESGGDAPGGLRFVVDPIDGTRAFIRGLPTWSVLVGLEDDGRPVAAVAYLPAAGDLFTGAQGHGAYVNGRPATLSTVSELSESTIAHGGMKQFTDDGRGALLAELARQTYTQRGLGDFASYAALLRGQVDAVVDPDIAPYDVAPADLLVREAGGRFSNLDGEPTIYGPGGLASNGLLHDGLLALIAASVRD